MDHYAAHWDEQECLGDCLWCASPIWPEDTYLIGGPHVMHTACAEDTLTYLLEALGLRELEPGDLTDKITQE